MFDFTSFFEVSAKSGPIVVLIVLGLVQLYGKAGVSGKWQLFSSLFTGIIIGGAFQVAALGTPATFAEWFAVVMYGLLMGLTATGTYEVGKKLLSRPEAQG